jgi:hypothetical protein
MYRNNLLKIFNPKLPKTQQEIESIKKDFLLKDIIHKSNSSLSIDLNKSIIETVVVFNSKNKQHIFDDDEFDSKNDDLVQVDFYEEFAKALADTLDSYISKFIVELERKYIYTVNDLDGYKRFKLKKINEFIQELELSDVETKSKDILKRFYEDMYGFISSFNIDDTLVSNKLKFKLNKNQLIWLFQTMLNKGVISGISNLDLYRILETNSMYYDGSKYHDMSNVRTQAHKLTNGASSTKKTIEELSKIFDKNFFL